VAANLPLHDDDGDSGTYVRSSPQGSSVEESNDMLTDHPPAILTVKLSRTATHHTASSSCPHNNSNNNNNHLLLQQHLELPLGHAMIKIDKMTCGPLFFNETRQHLSGPEMPFTRVRRTHCT
jgi:hypothetical protein